MLDKDNLKPNEAERQFLNIAYNKFYDIFDEIIDEKFWIQNSYFRLCKIRECFSIYSELTHYEPIQYVFKYIKKARPPMEAEIGQDVFIFIRNLLIHFPLFDSWDDFYITKDLANWAQEGMSIDKFLKHTRTKRWLNIDFGKKIKN